MKRMICRLLLVALLISIALPMGAAQALGSGWYVVDSTSPYGYCYLYSKASDSSGRNLGRYDNYETVKVIEYYGGQQGKYNYCYVITHDNKLGYIHDYSLRRY